MCSFLNIIIYKVISCILSQPPGYASPRTGVAFHLSNHATILQGWELHSFLAIWLRFSRDKNCKFVSTWEQLCTRTGIKLQSTMHLGSSWCIEGWTYAAILSPSYSENLPYALRIPSVTCQLSGPFSSIRHSGGLRRRLHSSDTRANLWGKLDLLTTT